MGLRKYGRCGKNAVGWYAIRDPKTRREWRAILLQRQSERCALCGHRFPSAEQSESIRVQFAPTFDHIVGYAAGGSSDLANLRLVHNDCNRSRESGRVVAVPRVLRLAI
jgi:5-methylcytosine-specific restriction endonuclease McrA